MKAVEGDIDEKKESGDADDEPAFGAQICGPPNEGEDDKDKYRRQDEDTPSWREGDGVGGEPRGECEHAKKRGGGFHEHGVLETRVQVKRRAERDGVVREQRHGRRHDAKRVRPRAFAK